MCTKVTKVSSHVVLLLRILWGICNFSEKVYALILIVEVADALSDDIFRLCES